MAKIYDDPKSSKNLSVFGILMLYGGGLVLFLAVMFGIIYGPVGIKNQWNAWFANAYGSDWLIIQYKLDGSVLNHWELKNSAVHNEAHSDGIFFTTDEGVVHLSHQYMYIQHPSPTAKAKFLKEQPQ